jgi:hypothetical protein
MAPDSAAGRLEKARENVRQAMAQWHPADLAQVENSTGLLVAAIQEMRLFESAAQAGEVLATEELCATILAVKQEIVQATRVVDACVAFHRGLSALSGGAPPVYDAAGHIAGESSGMEPEVHA